MEPPKYTSKDDGTLADKKHGMDPANELGSPDHVSITSGQDVLAMQDIDPALNMKMHLVNNVSIIVHAYTSQFNPDWALCRTAHARKR